MFHLCLFFRSKRMTDADCKKRVFELLQKDKFAEACGVELLEVGDGTAKGRMIASDMHNNGLGVVQGGALFTLADLVCSAASCSRGKVTVTINASMNYVKPAFKGVLTATATELYLRRTISAYNVEIRDEEGELIATFQSTCYRKDTPIA